MEVQIRAWLQVSPDTTTVKSAGKTHTLHRLPIGQVYSQATEMGYKDVEVDTLLEVMEVRGLIERDRRGNLQEALRQVPSVDEVADMVSELQSNINHLQTAFPQAKEFRRLAEEVEKYTAKAEQLRETADEATLVSLRRTVTTRLRDVRVVAEDRQAELRQKSASQLRRLPGLDAQRRNTLETQVAGVKYADQVNNLRIRLLRAYIRFGTQVDELRRRLEAIERALANEELPLADLAKEAATLYGLGQDVAAIHKSGEKLTEQYRQFTDWRRLVEDGARLFDELQILGDPATDLMDAFEKLSQDVRGDISAHALDALPNVTTYASRLNELRTQARRLRDRAVETFNDLQNRYRDEFVRTIGYPRDRLWDPLIYSTLDPVGIYQQLYGRVASTLANVVDRMQRLQSNHLSRVRNLLNTPRLADLPSRDRKRIEKQGQELETQLSQIGDELEQAQERAAVPDGIRDFPAEGDGGAFRKLLTDLQALYNQLETARRGLDAITAVLRKQALSPEETKVWKALEKTSPAGGFIDLAALRAEGRALDDGALWSALRGLWEKQRVQIQARPVRYDEG